MAGSRKWFIYTDDAGNDYAINLDESNTEAVNAGTQDYPDGGTLLDAVPRNIQPREAIFRSVDRTVSRRCKILTPTIYGALAAGSNFTDPVSGKTVYLSLKRGEVQTIPLGVDSGLTDGDAT